MEKAQTLKVGKRKHWESGFWEGRIAACNRHLGELGTGMDKENSGRKKSQH